MQKSHLLFHHTETPTTITSSGNRNWLVRVTSFLCERVMVMRRSSCSLGRIEIRSSSDDNQSTAFNARSLLPLKLMNEFSAHDELPTTTNRPCESCLPVLYVPAAAIVSGPFLFLGSFGSTVGLLKLLVAKLVSDVSNNFCTEVLS